MNLNLTNYSGEIAALIAACLWACSSMIFSLLGRKIRSSELNLLKGVVAIVLMAAAIPITGESLTRIQPLAFWLLIISGVVGLGLGDTSYFESLRMIGPRRALLLTISAPPMTAILAALFLGEHLALTAWLGIGVTILGVAWVITEQTPLNGVKIEPAALRAGVLFASFSALCQSIGAVLSRAALTMTDVTTLQSGMWRLLAGIVVLSVWVVLSKEKSFTWLKGGNTAKMWGMIFLATVFGTFLGIWLQQIAIQKASVGIAQTLLATSPIFILPLAALSGEKLTLRSVLGALVAMVGISMLFGVV